MATTRTTLTLTGGIQQVIYRQAWQASNRRMLILLIFPSSAITNPVVPRPYYELWVGRGSFLSTTTSITGMSHTAYRKVWSPAATLQAPLPSTAALDYTDAVFVRGLNETIGATVNFDYVDSAP